MSRVGSTLILLFLTTFVAVGQEKGYNTHEWRLGWGDMMFEHAIYHNTPENYNYCHIGHFFGEYQCNLTNWFGLGFEGDWEKVLWDTEGKTDCNFYNLSFLTTMRFTYYRKGIVTMYSGLGAGLTINGGSELDYKGRKTIVAPALNITAYGISFNFTPHWFGTFEIGGLNALNGKNEVLMAASRIFSLSIGYRL